MKDAAGTHLVDDLSRDYKKVDVGATPSAEARDHDSAAWNVICLRS